MWLCSNNGKSDILTLLHYYPLLHSGRSELHTNLAFLSAIGLGFDIHRNAMSNDTWPPAFYFV